MRCHQCGCVFCSFLVCIESLRGPACDDQPPYARASDNGIFHLCELIVGIVVWVDAGNCSDIYNGMASDNGRANAA